MPEKKAKGASETVSESKTKKTTPKKAVEKKKSAKTATVKKTAVPDEGAGQVIFSLQAGTPIFVKTADICAATGKTNQWIGQLTSQGVIHKTKTNHGSLYNLFETIKAYCAMLEGRVKKPDTDASVIELRRKEAEAKLKESKALIAELEAKEFQGKMHRSEDVQAMTAELLYYVRGSLIALAGRCATKCAATSEPAEAQKIIEQEVFAILKDLSEYKYDKKRYTELVRQRASFETDTEYPDDD